MIWLYSGTPGSGKSLHAANELITQLRLGRNVIANFPIDTCYFKKKNVKFFYVDNFALNVNYLKQFAKEHHKLGKESQSIIIIDECSTFFNSRDIDRKDRMQWITFFQQHRKLGYDVILIAQQDRMIDRQIRGFIETEVKHRSISHYKTFGWILDLLFGGLFIAIEYWYPMRLRTGASFFRLNKRKANIYNTFEIFETGDGSFNAEGTRFDIFKND